MKVNIALLTVTDTRTFDNDKSGAILVDKIKEANHNLLDRKIMVYGYQHGGGYDIFNVDICFDF